MRMRLCACQVSVNIVAFQDQPPSTSVPCSGLERKNASCSWAAACQPGGYCPGSLFTQPLRYPVKYYQPPSNPLQGLPMLDQCHITCASSLARMAFPIKTFDKEAPPEDCTSAPITAAELHMVAEHMVQLINVAQPDCPPAAHSRLDGCNFDTHPAPTAQPIPIFADFMSEVRHYWAYS